MLAPRTPRTTPRVLLGSLALAGTLALGACSDDDDDDMDPTIDQEIVEDSDPMAGAGDTSMPAPGTGPDDPIDMSPITYTIPLTVEEEVPEPTGVPEGATGEAVLVYDPATRGITGTITTANLSGPPTMAHIHEQQFEGAELQPTGPNIVDFVMDGTGAGFELPGDSVLTEEQAESLETGLLYVNVHTAQNQPGEIRGQIVRDEEDDGDAEDSDTDTDGT